MALAQHDAAQRDERRSRKTELLRAQQTGDGYVPHRLQLTVRLNDAMLDLDRPITVTSGGKTLFSGPVKRTIRVLAKTLAERGDPKGMFRAEVTVELPSEK